MIKLTSDAVETIVRECLFTEEEMAEIGRPEDISNIAALDAERGLFLVEGITCTFGFHKERLQAKREDIRDLLLQLPSQFRLFTEGGAGGWSFLNAHEDKDGVQWGEHKVIEVLVCLGIAVGHARFLLPRKMWSMAPGGMPYFCVSRERM